MPFGAYYLAKVKVIETPLRQPLPSDTIVGDILTSHPMVRAGRSLTSACTAWAALASRNETVDAGLPGPRPSPWKSWWKKLNAIIVANRK
ncbi:MAG: hypothetical protein ACLR1T_02215 [Evtepia gabavorous]